MLIKQFFTWWYGAGWLATVTSLNLRLRKLNQAFSTTTLLRTLFAPWRRIISYPGASFDAKIHAMIDNLFSRIVGFFVRCFVIIAAVISFFVAILVTIIEIIIWPLLPIAVVGFIILAVAH